MEDFWTRKILNQIWLSELLLVYGFNRVWDSKLSKNAVLSWVPSKQSLKWRFPNRWFIERVLSWNRECEKQAGAGKKAERQYGLSWSLALPDSSRKPYPWIVLQSGSNLREAGWPVAFLNQTIKGHNLLSQMDVFGQGLFSEESAAMSQRSTVRGSGREGHYTCLCSKNRFFTRRPSSISIA